MKSVVIVFWFFHPAPKLETLARRPQLRTREKTCSERNSATYKLSGLRKKVLLRIKKNKIKKKRAKLSSGLSKKQVQALRVF
jgi:hypothetical protein